MTSDFYKCIAMMIFERLVHELSHYLYHFRMTLACENLRICHLLTFYFNVFQVEVAIDRISTEMANFALAATATVQAIGGDFPSALHCP